MLDRLLKFEGQLARLEALLLVVFVLMMLALATYNVFYRNVLVPIQVRLITDQEAQTAAEAPVEKPDQGQKPATADGEEGAGGGFGGGFGEEESEGFGGGFGDEPAETASSGGEAPAYPHEP